MIGVTSTDSELAFIEASFREWAEVDLPDTVLGSLEAGAFAEQDTAPDDSACVAPARM